MHADSGTIDSATKRASNKHKKLLVHFHFFTVYLSNVIVPYKSGISVRQILLVYRSVKRNGSTVSL